MKNQRSETKSRKSKSKSSDHALDGTTREPPRDEDDHIVQISRDGSAIEEDEEGQLAGRYGPGGAEG